MLLVVGLLALNSQSWIDRLKSKLGEPDDQIGVQVVPRDGFPVFNNPKFVNADKAERKGYVHDRDAVIGVEINGETKAYPVSTMGVHELGNDTLGDVPIAVSW